MTMSSPLVRKNRLFFFCIPENNKKINYRHYHYYYKHIKGNRIATDC